MRGDNRPRRQRTLLIAAVLTLCTGLRSLAGEVAVRDRVIDGDGGALAAPWATARSRQWTATEPPPRIVVGSASAGSPGWLS